MEVDPNPDADSSEAEGLAKGSMHARVEVKAKPICPPACGRQISTVDTRVASNEVMRIRTNHELLFRIGVTPASFSLLASTCDGGF